MQKQHQELLADHGHLQSLHEQLALDYEKLKGELSKVKGECREVKVSRPHALSPLPGSSDANAFNDFFKCH